MTNIIERLKSIPLWFAIAALIAFCVKEFGGWDIQESLDGLLNVLIPVAIGFGIVNNPTDRDHF